MDGVIYNVVVDCPEGGIAESEFKNNFLLRYLRDGSRKTIDLNMYSIVANGKVVETRQLLPSFFKSIPIDKDFGVRKLLLRSTDGLKEYEPKQRIEGSKHNMEMLQSELKPLRHSIGRCFFFNKNVHSPFVLRYYGLLSENDVTHIFMEYCENGDLKDYVNRRKTELSEKEILSIFAQVVVGLSVLHKNGIIHRDVKHCNILLNKETWRLNWRISGYLRK